uniref:Uncharacterized protein n=1 Tax=Panagrolaimus sp. PS1159 TaxID=55785 RepID=A0AC35GTU7_9BILA
MNERTKSCDDQPSNFGHHVTFPDLPKITHTNFEKIDDSKNKEGTQNNPSGNLDNYNDPQTTTYESDQESTKFLHLNVFDILKRERSLSEMTELSETLARRASNLSEISKIILEKENEETAKLIHCWKKLLFIFLCFIGLVILLAITYFCVNLNI